MKTTEIKKPTQYSQQQQSIEKTAIPFFQLQEERQSFFSGREQISPVFKAAIEPPPFFSPAKIQLFERNAEAREEQVQRKPASQDGGAPMIQLRAAPYIKKISVHLAPPQTADLEWQGTPPDDAPGVDHFTVSTGKGYADPWDPAGTCTRTCCKDAMTQCAPPWNQPGRVGACCTFYGDDFWTGRPLESHNGWNWWTPIQPYYSQRGIALHQHHEVTGQPIGHGCVRMEDENAKRIHDFSNGRRTKVKIDGRAAPVQCEESQQCEDNSSGMLEDSGNGSGAVANNHQVPVPGMEGVLT